METRQKKQEAKVIGAKLQEVLKGGCKFIFVNDPLDRVYEVDEWFDGMIQQWVYRNVLVGLEEKRIPEGSINRVESHGDILCVQNTMLGIGTEVKIHTNDIAIL